MKRLTQWTAHDMLLVIANLITTQRSIAMRKIIPLAAIVAVAAIAMLWSKSAFERPTIVRTVEATEAVATISPFEIMVTRGKDLPVEHPTDPF